MDIILSLLEILKYIIPALVVYLLMRQFISGHMAAEQMKIRALMNGDNRAIRIQAYERLTLFCERINLLSLVLRLNNEDMNASHLKNALLISIQKEYEHNLTQQIYVSNQLWQMVTLLKDNIIATITQSYVDHQKKDKEDFEAALIATGRTIDATLSAKVREAIRKEVELYFR